MALRVSHFVRAPGLHLPQATTKKGHCQSIFLAKAILDKVDWAN